MQSFPLLIFVTRLFHPLTRLVHDVYSLFGEMEVSDLQTLAVAVGFQRISRLAWLTFTLQNCRIKTATTPKYSLLPSSILLHHFLSSIYSLRQQILIDSPVNQVPASQVPNRQVYKLLVISNIRGVKSLPSSGACHLKICPKCLV